ncbi:hypothetical protein MW887_008490 [Aspergillus wentii]|nr:hypothetical protein MW887_008490 [Aspergillus wentii]
MALHALRSSQLPGRGEITDPPAAETNPDVYGPGASSPPFESTDFTGTSLFCAQCVRNQHLFTSTLASYFPSPEDPTYSAYEREYPSFRQNMEERYPQVCAKCEPRVRDRIRQAGYEAKSDHLRRMMDRSKAGRASRQARNRNWRSLLVFAGAVGYWGSAAGQLAWDILSALNTGEPLRDSDGSSPVPSLASCAQQTLQLRYAPSNCLMDLTPHAGLALVAGILSLWWNPKLRFKVEGRGGRFVGLGEYYQVQLIVMVVRCVFWGVLKDPSSSGLESSMLPGLHLFMIVFTVLSIAISRRVIQYDTRPLVSWSEFDTPAVTPRRKPEASQAQSTAKKEPFAVINEDLHQSVQPFPLEKLATPRAALEREPAIPPTPPPEVDDMDWTPSLQREIRPTISVHQRDQKSVLDGPMPFYGSLPAAPKPPSWNLRTQPSQKPIEQVVERNPFHRAPAQSPSAWQRNPGRPDVFAPPKFFPMTDHVASTGLESLFDRAFTIKSAEDEGKEDWKQKVPQVDSQHRTDMRNLLLSQYLRLGLLLASILAWTLSQYGLLSVPGNYIEVASLGSASLIAGFALLEVLKRPIVQWNGMEILVYFAELVAAVHLGGNLPRVSFEREYFDRYGKLLLIFMAAQEGLGLLAILRAAPANGENSRSQQPNHTQSNQAHSSGQDVFTDSPMARPGNLLENQSFHSQPSVPPLSFSSTAAGSGFSPESSGSPYQVGLPYNQGFSGNHSFSLNSLKDNESDVSDPLDRDSDTETTVTTATTATNNTIRNIRYGRNVNENFFSPKRSELGPGIGGLSLDDNKPHRRVTRSQTQRRQQGDGFRKYPVRGLD